jgi:hypothetical protein
MALVCDGVLPVRPAANANRWASGRLKEQKIHRLAGVELVPAVSFEGVFGLQVVVGLPASAFRSGRLALRGVRSCLIFRLSRLARFGFRSWCRRLAVSVTRSGFVRRRVSLVEFVCPPALSGQGGLLSVLREVSAGVWVMSVCQPSLFGQVGWLAV